MSFSVHLYVFSIRRISLDEHVRGKSFPTQWLMQMLCNLFMEKKAHTEQPSMDGTHKTISHFVLAKPAAALSSTYHLCLFICLFDRCCRWCSFFKLTVNWKVKWNTDLLCTTFAKRILYHNTITATRRYWKWHTHQKKQLKYEITFSE